MRDIYPYFSILYELVAWLHDEASQLGENRVAIEKLQEITQDLRRCLEPVDLGAAKLSRQQREALLHHILLNIEGRLDNSFSVIQTQIAHQVALASPPTRLGNITLTSLPWLTLWSKLHRL